MKRLTSEEIFIVNNLVVYRQMELEQAINGQGRDDLMDEYDAVCSALEKLRVIEEEIIKDELE